MRLYRGRIAVAGALAGALAVVVHQVHALVHGLRLLLGLEVERVVVLLEVRGAHILAVPADEPERSSRLM